VILILIGWGMKVPATTSSSSLPRSSPPRRPRRSPG
jgi:hypothetical protein